MSDQTPAAPPVPAYGEDDEAKSLAQPAAAAPQVPVPSGAPAGTTETDIARNVAEAAARAKPSTSKP